MGIRANMNAVTKGVTIAVAVRRSAQWANPVAGSPASALETAAFLDSFGPSLMPHSSTLQGASAGMSVLAARGTMAVIESATGAIVNKDDPLSHHLLMRGLLGGLGQALSTLPVRDGESLARAGVRTSGRLLRAGAIGGAIYDVGQAAQDRYPASGFARPLLISAAGFAGILVWSSQRLEQRKAAVDSWPIPQPNELVPTVVTGAVVVSVGSVGSKAFMWSRGAWMDFFGDTVMKRRLGGAVNAAMWAGALSALYNSGIGYIGRANEKIEPAYANAPTTEFVSGSPASISPYGDLGQQGRRFVTDVLTPEYIDDAMDEKGAIHPIRVFIGYNSEPMYPTGRAEMALSEMDRLGAFDRDYIVLASPTGTGWIDQTFIESVELLARGDIASVCIQYGKFPSFLSVQKVALGRAQFRLLLWGVKQRLAERAPEDRPKVLVFGESLGAWTSSDVVMFNGMSGFDHYGIDKALWVGLPWLAKWSKGGLSRGASDLVPEGTVGVFDRPEQLLALSAEDREALRVVILSHDNDPIAVMGPDLLIREPSWLRNERGRGVPSTMTWSPLVTAIQVLVDAANAMVMVPGHFGSFGHDYRADMAQFVLKGLGLPATTDAQMESVEASLRSLELDRAERIKAEHADVAPPAPSQVANGKRVVSGVPLYGKRTSGAKWLKSILRRSGVPEGDVQ
jgi:uncharacterized membrane protein